MTLVAGQTFEIDYPFLRDDRGVVDDHIDWSPWKPGVEYVAAGGAPDDPEFDLVAHAVGKKISTVVAVVSLPRPFPPLYFKIIDRACHSVASLFGFSSVVIREPNGGLFACLKILFANLQRTNPK